MSCIASGSRYQCDLRAGLEALATAQELVDYTGDRWREAALYRLLEELLLPAGVRGLQAAHHQSACRRRRGAFVACTPRSPWPGGKSLELRAAMGLSRLWHC